MKRLLAYLFIALGLGLTFSINASAESGYCIDGLTSSFYRDSDGKKHFLKGSYWVKKIKNRKNHRDCHDEEFISKAKYEVQYKKIKKLVGPFKKNKSIPLNSILTSIKGTHVLDEYNRIYEAINNTQIAKAEPSQTQEAKDYWDAVILYPNTNEKFVALSQSTERAAKNIAMDKCYNWVKINIKKADRFMLPYYQACSIYLKTYNKQTQIAKAEPSQTQKVAEKVTSRSFCVSKSPQLLNDFEYRITEISILFPNCTSNFIINDNYKDKLFYAYLLDTMGTSEIQDFRTLEPRSYWKPKKKVKIAKAEPSQTQKVASKVFYDVAFCHPKNSKPLSATITVWANIVGEKSKMKCNYNQNEAKFEDIYNYKKLSICLGNKITRSGFTKNYFLGQAWPVSCSENSWPIAIKYDGERFYSEKKTQIAKAEPTVTPKKKVKVAKVEDSTQEEFKPETGDIDNEAPVIEIAEAITVNDTSYILEGKVTDKADKIFVEIDGQPVQVKKGKFKVKRYSPVDEQIKIVAIDQWGNKSKTKLVNITIDIEETIVANKLEPLNPSNISNKSSNNKVALIIGIENYTEAPKANYANLDAKYFFDYARRAFGVNKQNINLLVNEEATVVKTDKAVSLWLKSKIKKNKSDLIIFFAGHGLASSDGKELYLLPQDGNPDRLERTALSRTDLFKEIISLNPKSVTMFLDTCYSGVSRDEQMLLASARPVRIVANDQEGIPDNFTIFSASQLDQISSGLKEANHGIFSYYLMKGLEGKADINQDKKITNGELLAYMDENVSQKASELGRQQNPSLAGDPDKVLMSYR